MYLLVWCVLLLLLCPGSMETVVDRTRHARGQNIMKTFRRHSDGTFTSDFTQYLDKIKAKDFVEWLASTKHMGCDKDQLKIKEV